MERVRDREKKAKLAVQYDIICHAIDRAALCLDILGYRVSVEISKDFSTVRFWIPKQEERADTTPQKPNTMKCQCGSTDFWQRPAGQWGPAEWLCSRCHPNPYVSRQAKPA
jgi:hypothetical protein